MDAQSVLNDGLAQHNYILIGAGAVALLVPIVLHALGKDIPYVSPLLDAMLNVVQSLVKKPAVPATPPPEDGKVVSLQEYADAQKKDQPK